jgi:uncharacterized protein YjaG (DUF416 family)
MADKKLVDYYMSLPYTIHVERMEAWGTVSYKASVLEFNKHNNCEVIQLTEEQAYNVIREIMRTWIITRLDLKDMPIPKPKEY